MSLESATRSLTRWFDDGGFAADLSRRIGYRTVSQGTAHRADIDAYLAEVVVPELTAMGFTCRVLANPVPGGPPFLLAERHEGGHRPTVLTYGHGDVVDGQDALWSAGLDPWTMTERDGAWYGRGAADNKGQHAVNFAALREVIAARQGSLGYNVKVLFEMGEECSSPGLREVARAHEDELRADLFLASDGPRLVEESPTIFLGSRGSVVFELSYSARETALHSGNWGGIVANPAVVLSHAISGLVGRRGRIEVAGLLPPEIPEDVRTELAALPIDSAHLGRRIDEDWGQPGLTPAERLLGWNTLEVLTLHAGDDAKPVNAVPGTARAHCQLRFVVGTRWDRLQEYVRAHLDAAGFPEVEVRIVRGSPATRVSPGDPWVRWAKTSIEDAMGRPPLVNPNLGGTVPNDVFAEILGLPTVWVPHSYPGCRQHGPDEHLPVAVAREGLAVMAALFWNLGVTDPITAGGAGARGRAGSADGPVDSTTGPAATPG
ncbi:M20 family metallopeptidase [Nocardiopsis mangrovi]|uniref:M20 family metallopeptidase n=1 Tax=Nocardiopsis mangrovi TaxID=1179818 RepID=A0ABV9DX16_9ACTN